MKVDRKIHVAMVCKHMPLYRTGIFKYLSKIDGNFIFTFLGDNNSRQAGIEQIPLNNHRKGLTDGIRFIKTKNYFYKSEKLLWQTGIVSRIFQSHFKIFVFEGAISQIPVWFFAILCKLKGKKVFYWTHGNRGNEGLLNRFFRKILFKNLGDGVFLYGHFQRDIMIKQNYDPDKLHVIYNSLETHKQLDVYNSLPEKINLPNVLFDTPENFTLIFIGRLVEHKGVMDIIQVINSLKKDRINVNCIFIGEGNAKNDMTSLIRLLNIEDQVHFTGALYDELEIAPYFKISDLLISPGNVGLNCIHSLTYGVPVITHDNFIYQNPEVEAIVNHKNGILFKYQNLNSLVENIKGWIKNRRSKESTVKDCQEIVLEKYNPRSQALEIIKGLQTLDYD